MELQELREVVVRCAALIPLRGTLRRRGDDMALVADVGDYRITKYIGESRVVLSRTMPTHVSRSGFVLAGPYEHADRKPRIEFVVGDTTHEEVRSALEALRRYMVLDDLAAI